MKASKVCKSNKCFTALLQSFYHLSFSISCSLVASSLKKNTQHWLPIDLPAASCKLCHCKACMWFSTGWSLLVTPLLMACRLPAVTRTCSVQMTGTCWAVSILNELCECDPSCCLVRRIFNNYFIRLFNNWIYGWLLWWFTQF